MNLGKIVADGWTGGRVDGKIKGSTRGPRGPKNAIRDEESTVRT